MTLCRDYYGRVYRCNHMWNSWGRWVLFGILVAGAILLFFLFRYAVVQPPPRINLLTNPPSAVFQLVAVAREACSHSTVLDGLGRPRRATEPQRTTLSTKINSSSNSNLNMAMATNNSRHPGKKEDTTIKTREDTEQTKDTMVASRPGRQNCSNHPIHIVLEIKSTRRQLDLRPARKELCDERLARRSRKRRLGSRQGGQWAIG
jgi:hypothetical protein